TSRSSNSPPARLMALETPPLIVSQASSELTSTWAWDDVMLPKRSVIVDGPTRYVRASIQSPEDRSVTTRQDRDLRTGACVILPEREGPRGGPARAQRTSHSAMFHVDRVSGCVCPFTPVTP